MSEQTKDGGRAFPVLCNVKEGSDWIARDGMSLRDWFAGQALAGLMADPEMNADPKPVARVCYNYADAMLAAREVQE